ncbi:MAG: 3-oxoacyl-[acyl-carrier-protein] reductase [Oscillospiraceae bacterium]|nr:3-oxoacyl-[acyl-carrier-protein] reductase [Oscillospiraceae bacterium]
MLQGKTAIITGGSRGIGRAIALTFAEHGANVAVLYAGNATAADEVVCAIKAKGVSAMAIQCDVADFAACKDAVKAVTETLGPVDILVNNAGITKDKLVLAMSEDDFDRVVDVNLKGAFNMIKHCYSGFMKRRQGRIINITSISGLMGNPGQANYSSAKAGMIGLTKSVARELAGRNICCNAIAPGFIETEMTASLGENPLLNNIPLKRMGTADEVASLALFLASDTAGYITGEVIRVDGGLAM